MKTLIIAMVVIFSLSAAAQVSVNPRQPGTGSSGAWSKSYKCENEKVKFIVSESTRGGIMLEYKLPEHKVLLNKKRTQNNEKYEVKDNGNTYLVYSGETKEEKLLLVVVNKLNPLKSFAHILSDVDSQSIEREFELFCREVYPRAYEL